MLPKGPKINGRNSLKIKRGLRYQKKNMELKNQDRNTRNTIQKPKDIATHIIKPNLKVEVKFSSIISQIMQITDCVFGIMSYEHIFIF